MKKDELTTREQIIKYISDHRVSIAWTIGLVVGGGIIARGYSKELTKQINTAIKLVSDAGFGNEMADVIIAAIHDGKAVTTMNYNDKEYKIKIKASTFEM